MKFKNPPQTFTVTHSELLSDDMKRVWLKSDASFEQFGQENEGDYIKLVFTAESDKPVLRTYTVSRVDSVKELVAIDFVLHGELTTPVNLDNGGFAHHFASSAKQGDRIELFGPNTKKSVLPNYEQTLFVADPSALPALEGVLRHNKVAGTLVLYNCSEQLMERLSGYGLPIYSAASADELNEVLVAHKSLTVNSLWCAGEYQVMRAVRRFASDNFEIQRENQYLSSYWKPGMTEDGHKVFKQSEVNND